MKIKRFWTTESKGVFTWDRHEFVSVCIYMRPVWKWTQTGLTSSRSLDRDELVSYRSEFVPFSCKRKRISDRILSHMFLLLVHHFLLFLSNDSITIAKNIVDNVRKQDVESSINWIYACVNACRECTILWYCTVYGPPYEQVHDIFLSSVNSTVVYWRKLCASWLRTC